MDALTCMEAMHARLGRLETMWDARYTRRRGEEPVKVRDGVQTLSKLKFWPDDNLIVSPHGRLELISAFADKDGVEAQTWMTTQFYGSIEGVKLMKVVRHTETSMGVSCPTTVCKAEIEMLDSKKNKKTNYYITIKFRKVTDEQAILLGTITRTLAEVELDNILMHLKVLGREVLDLFPDFIMAMRVHHRTTGSVWEGIGMRTLEHVPADAKSRGDFYKSALQCLEKLHRAGGAHGNPTLDSFMLKRTAESPPQLCMTNFSTFRTFPLQDWNPEQHYKAPSLHFQNDYSNYFITKVMILMDYLKMFWLNNPRLPAYAEKGEDAFNEFYLHCFRSNEEVHQHIIYFAPWTPTRLLCFELNWDATIVWREIQTFVNYIAFLDSLTLHDIAQCFMPASSFEEMHAINSMIS